MNREIKFRGKRVDNGEWEYGDLIHYNEQFVINVYETEIGYYAYQVPIIPETVGQFTGLLDKNGKEIYEGDILQFHIEGRIHIVVYEKATFRLRDKNGNFTTSAYPDWSLIEIIGNIHDNQDLLK